MKEKVSPAIAIPAFVLVGVLVVFGAWKMFFAPAPGSNISVDVVKARNQKEAREDR